jgi:hypothetical protein
MSPWPQLSCDPRAVDRAGQRASDADRDRVQALLSTAYADGRLDRVEHDHRATALWQATTHGELGALVADLRPDLMHAPAIGSAGQSWQRLAHGFLWPSLACVLLWRFTGPGLFWPLWVIVYTGLPLLREARARWRRRYRGTWCAGKSGRRSTAVRP